MRITRACGICMLLKLYFFLKILGSKIQKRPTNKRNNPVELETGTPLNVPSPRENRNPERMIQITKNALWVSGSILIDRFIYSRSLLIIINKLKTPMNKAIMTKPTLIRYLESISMEFDNHQNNPPTNSNIFSIGEYFKQPLSIWSLAVHETLNKILREESQMNTGQIGFRHRQEFSQTSALVNQGSRAANSPAYQFFVELSAV